MPCDPDHIRLINWPRIARQARFHGVRIRRVKVNAKRFSNLQSVIAITLIVWCAGAGCMLVSYARTSMAESAGPSDSVDHMMAGMSSSMDAHACCKAKHRSAD